MTSESWCQILLLVLWVIFRHFVAKNNLRGITMVIGHVWGINSLAPLSSLKKTHYPSGAEFAKLGRPCLVCLDIHLVVRLHKDGH